mgnify:CR=1 FL=1
MSLNNLVNYEWQLALGNTPLTQEEFEALVALKSPLVQIRGQWVQLDPEQIEAAIRFWQSQELTGTMSLHEALQTGLDGQQGQNGLSVTDVELDSWLNQWLGRLQGDEPLALLPEPDGLEATLRPYQQYGYSWLHFAQQWGMGVIIELGRDSAGLYGIGAYRPAFLVTALVGVVAVGVYGVGPRVDLCRTGGQPSSTVDRLQG